MAINPEAFANELIQFALREVSSQDELARKIGVAPRTYKRWLTGEVEPHPSNVRLVALYYGLDPVEFLTELMDDTGSLSDRLERIESALTLLLEHFDLLGPPEGELADLLRALPRDSQRRVS